MRWTLPLLLLPGCLRDLPDDLGEDAVALFRAFETDDVALVDRVVSLDAQLDGLDLDARVGKRLFDLPELTLEDLGDLPVPEGLDTTDQMRAALAGRSRHDLEANLRAQLERDQSCLNARSVQCQLRLPVDGTDPACFLDGSCTRVHTWNWYRIDTAGADFWLEAPVDFLRFDLPDGRLAAVSRTWIEEGFPNDSGKRLWTQRFGLDVFVEDPDDPATTRRYYATWLGPKVNGLTGSFLQQAVRQGLEEGFTRPDDWLDGDTTCGVDVDACLAAGPF